MHSLPLSVVCFPGLLLEEDRRLVDAAASTKVVEPGRVLAWQGEQLASAHFLLSGLACRSRTLADGQRQITALLVPGDSCDVHDCFQGRSDCTLKALTRSEVAEVPRSTLINWIGSRSSIAYALWRSSAFHTSVLTEWLLNIGHRPPAKRIAHLFCEMLVRLQRAGLAADAQFEIPLRQDEIGDLTGLSTVHVNRTLQSLRADGLITLRRQTLIIHDVEQLKRFALFDHAYLQVAGSLPSNDTWSAQDPYQAKPGGSSASH